MKTLNDMYCGTKRVTNNTMVHCAEKSQKNVKKNFETQRK